MNVKQLATLSLFALILICFSVANQTEETSAATTVDSGTCGANLDWILDSDGVLTISGTGPMYGYDYETFKSPWRSYESSLKQLVLEPGLTSIGHNAFYGCSGLTGILTIPDTVTTIDHSAFEGCSGFTGSLTIPSSVTSISSFAFKGCSGFTGSLTIPNSVTSIGMSAFDGCSGFTGSLTIPNSVNTIGSGAFQDCSGFTGSLTIPNSITTIDGVFWGCSGLTGTLNIPSSVTTIGFGAFYQCSGFTGPLIIPDSVTSIGLGSFSGCSGLTGTLDIPSSFTTIETGAFQDCVGLTSLTIPNGVTIVGDQAFMNCSGLTGSLTIPSSMTSIGSNAFFGCSSISSLIIPNSVTFIGDFAFANCTAMLQIAFGNGLTSISDTAFVSHKFYDTDGATVLSKTAEALKGYTYIGETAGKMIRQGSVPSHHVTYNVNGGTASAPTQSDVAEGSSFILASYSGTKSGYSFGGWSYGGTSYQPGSSITMGTSDITLTAIWTDKPMHHVTYNVNGGSSSAPVQFDVAEGLTFTVASYSGTKSGYTFGGWSYNSTTYQPGSSIAMGTSDITLTAVWTDKPMHHVTYNTNGGSASAPIQSDVAEGLSFTVASYSGSKSGYSFGGWSYGGKTYQPDSSIVMSTSDISLKAIWIESSSNTNSFDVAIIATVAVGILAFAIVIGWFLLRKI